MVDSVYWVVSIRVTTVTVPLLLSMLSGKVIELNVELSCLTPSARCVSVNFNSVAHVKIQKHLGNKIPVAANTCVG